MLGVFEYVKEKFVERCMRSNCIFAERFERWIPVMGRGKEDCRDR